MPFHPPVMLARTILRATLLVVAIAPLGSAQRVPVRDIARDDAHFSFYEHGPYRAGIPRPDSLLGYAIGDQNTQYAQQERTLLAIAASAPDRVRVEEFATTYERRRMRIYIVSSPANIARLDAIRGDLDRLADPRGTPQSELDAIAARTPSVVWISGSVHGNESPGFEACIQLLYQYAASTEPATMDVLRNALVIINPSSNPDGHERFTVWYNSINVANPDPASVEHREPWSIQGRFNHYRFDMNRDLIAVTQREVQGITSMMLKWHPMVTADLHGHVSSYFFPPAARPVNGNIGADASRWMETMGRANAAAFDHYGWQYFSRDTYDLFYPGYYDTWPSLNGAIGMTFETDGGGHRGLLWRRPDGSLISLRDGIAKHFVASMATISTTASLARTRVADYLKFRQAAVAEGRTGGMRRIVLSAEKDPSRAAELATTLAREGIEVHRTNAEFSTGAAHAYYDDGVSSRRFPAGSYIVDLAQPQGRLARAILEPSTPLDPTFAAAQVAKFQRNQRRGKRAAGEDYEFYDITAWSLPVAFGVDAFWTDDTSPVSGSPVTAPPVVPGSMNSETSTFSTVGGITSGRGATSAYVFAPDRSGAPGLAYHLLQDGYRVNVSDTPIDAGGRQLPRGSFIAYVARNDTSLAHRIDELARTAGVDVAGVSTAFAESGQYGIGSGSVVALPTPNIAILGDEGVSQPAYGALWYSFERRFGLPFTPIGYSYLGGGDLSKFTAIVMPSGSYGSRIGKDALEKLKTWVRAGGVLVTMGNATAWAADKATGLTTARLVGSDDKADESDKSDKADKPADTPAATPATAVTRRDSTTGVRTAATPDRMAEEMIPYRSTSMNANTPESVPGIHADVLLDRTHWLTTGYTAPRLTVLVEGDVFLKPSREGANVATFPTTGRLVRAGFVWPGNTERLLRGTSYLVDEPLGGGHVVMFTGEPMFRGWWRSLDRLVLNAVLLGPAY